MTPATAHPRSDTFIIAVVVASVVYNAVLAIINASVMPLGFYHVAITESLILLAAMVFIVHKGLYPEDGIPLVYLGFTLLMTIYISVVNKGPVIDFFRNILIIFCFFVAGTWVRERTVRLVFFISCGLVLAVLLLEMVDSTLYGDLFYPLSYYENTRGLQQFSFGGSKLFQNSHHFEGRFTFGLLDHRANSLFLEQVSLANFSGVALIFLVTFWSTLSKLERLFYAGTISLVLLTNDSRTMLLFSGICFIGYFVFPKIPSKLSVMIMPLIVLLGVLVYALKPGASGDTLDGRVVLTMRHILDLEIPVMLGLYAKEAAQFADSGYVYVIYAGTIFGLIAFWLFVTLFPGGESPDQRRCSYALTIFIFMNMMIGGTAIFSIKIAALMWFLAGFMKYSKTPRLSSGVQSRVALDNGYHQPRARQV